MSQPTYHEQCVGEFLADQATCRELENHFKTCPECERLLPDHCQAAQKIIEQSVKPKE